LTPDSASTGSRTISPKTPRGRGVSGSSGDYFSPAIVQSSPPPQGGRAGGYGGFAEPQPYEVDPIYSSGYNTSPKKQASDVLTRMNTIASGPFDAGRRPSAKNAFAPKNDDSAVLQTSTRGNSKEAYGHVAGVEVPARTTRKNGYGGFGVENNNQEDFEPVPFAASKRSETFPKQTQQDFLDTPARTPSAPGPRPDRHGRRTNAPSERIEVAHERQQSSTGLRDTSRLPPPRTSLVKPPIADKEGSLSIVLANEFGSGNPYHSPSVSQSSSNSGYSHSSRPSQPSSNSSPARSTGSRRGPADTANFDALMNDLQSSMDSLVPPSTAVPRPSPSQRQAPASDLYLDPAIQGGPRLKTAGAGVSVPRRQEPALSGSHDHSPQSPPRERHGSASRSRGECKFCELPITGKSVSSADGRLTGRYHKACFVCTTCKAPFSSSTFYVLNDKPYCEQDYHRLNGSLCGHCGVGIEGQYLEDETLRKYHPGCFRCEDCGQVLREGYFEVNDKAYCEKDALRRVQQQSMAYQPRNGGLRPPAGGRQYGLPSGNRLGPPSVRPRMEKRMTRLGMM
jgi:hypothetical protein